jgi:hypothetical protein
MRLYFNYCDFEKDIDELEPYEVVILDEVLND